MELGALQKAGPRTDIGEVEKVKDTKSAGREFEAMLIGQLMRSAFSPEQMGLGGETDSGGQTMLDFGREHLSRVIAEGGGLGLGKLI
jgi:Rod binding domain-containing protein